MGRDAAPERLESTAELFLQVRHGDAEALNRLVSIYLPLLQRWAHGRCPASARGLADTHDLVRVTLLRVLDKVGRSALEAYEEALDTLSDDRRAAVILKIELGCGQTLGRRPVATRQSLAQGRQIGGNARLRGLQLGQSEHTADERKGGDPGGHGCSSFPPRAKQGTEWK